ncbi:hypothetical protein GCM10027446_00420 [Angustibacter peucedani]
MSAPGWAAASAFDPEATDRRVLAGIGSRSVMMARTVDAAPDAVWSACTDPDRLPQWIGTPQGRLEYGEMFTFYGATCQVVRCEPPRLLELSWTLMGETNQLRLSITARPGGTEVVVEHAGIRNPVLMGYGPSWEERLAHLEEHLRGQQVPQHDCRALEAQLKPHWWALLPVEERPTPPPPVAAPPPPPEAEAAEAPPPPAPAERPPTIELDRYDPSRRR